MTGHLTSEQMSARLDGALEGPDATAVDRHLEHCEVCRVAMAQLAAQDAALRETLEHDPGEAYFESFAARVDQRLRAEGRQGRVAAPGWDAIAAWLTPRRMAWLGASAAVVVVAGLILFRPPALLEPELRHRISQVGPGTQAPAPPPAAPSADQRAPAASDRTMERDAAIPTTGAKEQERRLAGLERKDVQSKVADDLAASGAKGATTGSQAGQRAATAARAHEVRTNEFGDPVPVVDEKMRASAPAVSQESNLAPPPAEGPVRVSKSRVAEPLRAGASSTTREEAAQAQDLAKASAPEIRLCGVVVDRAGRVVPGAQVALLAPARSAKADERGRFCLTSAPGVYELSAMAVGYVPARQQVRVGGDAAEARIVLDPVDVVGRLGVSAAKADSVEALARAAERASGQASVTATAGAHEQAATAWQRVLDAGPAGALDLMARQRLAEERYRAWKAAPTEARKRAASSAVDAYLARKPGNPERERAEAWRDELSK